ncbi:MAG: hypothetical protein Q8K75_01805 [Chlamydiales bacterium]|nr:hypothetical protein [Chlamydiales bacterium]
MEFPATHPSTESKSLFKMNLNLFGCDAKIKLKNDSLDVKIGTLAFSLPMPFGMFGGSSVASKRTSAPTVTPLPRLPRQRSVPSPVAPAPRKPKAQKTRSLSEAVKNIVMPAVKEIGAVAVDAAKDFVEAKVNETDSKSGGLLSKLIQKATDAPFLAGIAKEVAGIALGSAPGGALLQAAFRAMAKAA